MLRLVEVAHFVQLEECTERRQRSKFLSEVNDEDEEQKKQEKLIQVNFCAISRRIQLIS